MPEQENLLQFKITLKDSKPPIWRRIVVPEDYTFFDLHVAIQDVFGWTDTHLHQFIIGNPCDRNSPIISWPYPDTEEEAIDERKTKLSDYIKSPKQLFHYEYDFGDGWMHDIIFEKIFAGNAKEKYPQILDGARACPPEDCGGIWGYYDLIEILKNPKHEEFQDKMEWLSLDDPKEFNPEEFDLKEVYFGDPKKVLKEYLKNFDS